MKQQCVQPKDLNSLKELIARRQIVLEPKIALVARFALERPVDVAFGSARMIASNCNVSASSVTRLAKTLGFDSFSSLKEIFKQSVREKMAHPEFADDFAQHSARNRKNEAFRVNETEAAS